MVGKVCLKLFPRETKELTCDVAVHDVNEMLKLMSVCLQFSNFQFFQDVTILQMMKSPF